MKRILIIVWLLLVGKISIAQDERPYVKTGFVIIQSTKDYNTAKATAQKAALQLKQKLDLRDLKANKKSGLTYSQKDCENEGGYPCYISRGRYDSGDYISIEWSNAFDGFAKGYYIVVIASGAKEETEQIGRASCRKRV